MLERIILYFTIKWHSAIKEGNSKKFGPPVQKNHMTLTYVEDQGHNMVLMPQILFHAIFESAIVSMNTYTR